MTALLDSGHFLLRPAVGAQEAGPASVPISQLSDAAGFIEVHLTLNSYV